jgi:hypothetical protein
MTKSKRPGKRETATGHEKRIEGQAGKSRRSSQDVQQVQAGGGAGAVEPASWPGWCAKKLGLTLQSEKTDGERVYRVTDKPDAGAEASTKRSAAGGLTMLLRLVDAGAVAAEIARVRLLSGGAVRRRRQAVFGRSPPEHLTADLFRRMIATKIQEEAFGTL